MDFVPREAQIPLEKEPNHKGTASHFKVGRSTLGGRFKGT